MSTPKVDAATMPPPTVGSAILDVRPEPASVSVYVYGALDPPPFPSQMKVFATDSAGDVVQIATTTSSDPGTPNPPSTNQQTTWRFDFAFPETLPAGAYTITAVSAALGLRGSSRLLLAPVPLPKPPEPGDLFIGVERPGYGGVLPGRVYRYASDAGGHAIFTSIDGDERYVGKPDSIVPLVADDAVIRLRNDLYNQDVAANAVPFRCFDAKGQWIRARLRAGRHLRVVEIARAARALTWLPDDPRTVVNIYPCNGSCNENKGIFVESPIVADFAINADDVEILWPTEVSMPSIDGPRMFDGTCVGGFAEFQTTEQMKSVFEPISH